jgi:hypothetical protein
MDQDLKQYLDANFARIDEGFEQISERFADVDRRAEAMKEDLIARIEKAETNLLSAFYGWARPMEVRIGGISTLVLGFDERLALAEQRISELERRKAS